MIKIMLVEDDKSLREIYGVRLLAEGYDIVSAGDGEEALAMAIKERPRLIISDVMMPKISGFDMLDILRSTTETKNIKVIMMTALSSEEQRERGEALGADRYLVKSQVGIEDVVRVVHEVLNDKQGTPNLPPAPVPATATPQTVPARPTVPPRPQAPVQMPQPTSTVSKPAPSAVQTPHAPLPSVTPEVVQAVQPLVAEPANEPSLASSRQMASAPSTEPADPTAPPTAPSAQPTMTPKPASLKSRIIQPLNDPSTEPVDIGELLDKELAKEAGISPDNIPTVVTTDQEKSLVDEQLSQFVPPAVPDVTISDDGTLKPLPTPPTTPPAPVMPVSPASQVTPQTQNALSGTTLGPTPPAPPAPPVPTV